MGRAIRTWSFTEWEMRVEKNKKGIIEKNSKA